MEKYTPCEPMSAYCCRDSYLSRLTMTAKRFRLRISKCCVVGYIGDMTGLRFPQNSWTA